MSDLLDSLQDMVAFKHDDMSVAKKAIDHIETQAARITELEAALQRIAAAGGLFSEPASGQHAREIARAALEGGKKDE